MEDVVHYFFPHISSRFKHQPVETSPHEEILGSRSPICASYVPIKVKVEPRQMETYLSLVETQRNHIATKALRSLYCC